MSEVLLVRALLIAAVALITSPLKAQEPASRCLAVAQGEPAVMPAAFSQAQDGMERPIGGEVTIRFIGHSTFLITSPEGVTIATDYNGNAGGAIPRVVTMNRAHGTHFTDAPDPRIEHVLRGWGEGGEPAAHHLQIGDVLIRNIATDIRLFGSGVRVPNGNSMFVFEVAGLCIGHLGHLHHILESEDLAWVGQLDVVMAPVDGSYTMAQGAMVDTLKVLNARLVLPMHYFGQSTLSRFLALLGEEFEVQISDGPEVSVSAATLPRAPTFLVLPGY